MTLPSAPLCLNHLGCDVAKAWLDLFDPQTGKLWRLPNQTQALAAWAAELPRATSFVVLEATGHHDRLLRHALARNGIGFARLNPAFVRHFAQAQGRLAKTDRLDARGLSRMGALLQPKADPAPDPAREDLAELARRRDQLVAMRAGEMRHLAEVAQAAVAADIQAHLDQLNSRIAGIEAAIAEHMRHTASLAKQAELLCSAPGVGPVTALTLLAHMPELGHLSPKQAASLAGLAPHPNDSGSKRGRRPLKGGRPRIRCALYMAALGAIRACPRFNTFYHALAQRAGSKKLAILATARKLLTALNAMIRDQKTFQ